MANDDYECDPSKTALHGDEIDDDGDLTVRELYERLANNMRFCYQPPGAPHPMCVVMVPADYDDGEDEDDDRGGA